MNRKPWTAIYHHWIILKTKNHQAFSLICQQNGFCGTHLYNRLKENRFSDPLQYYVYSKYKEIRIPIHPLWEKWMLVVVTQTEHFYSRRRVGVISTPCKNNCLDNRSYMYHNYDGSRGNCSYLPSLFPFKTQKKGHIQFLKDTSPFAHFQLRRL